MKKLIFLASIFSLIIIKAQNFNWENALSQIYVPQPGFAPEKFLLDRAPCLPTYFKTGFL
ncbi:hypothetical protein ACM44_14775 [Chryseobacterium koreense CCUG 49689]|uniref:Uncharacterized protein n=1 Tax=Chryseobacterium koreense CCUG 49689 TaxID=1304281 RepID=A0A0J7LF23_9FLAO|nr:hypothetical protein ACM44_14775 [Chryseobacterium koreense CCUG 49689]MBB5332632.1 hypothetical protein [Chryseobacterium koreense]